LTLTRDKQDAGRLSSSFHRREYDIPEEEHQEEVSRHPLAWLILSLPKGHEKIGEGESH
jgi:hypothetical protein